MSFVSVNCRSLRVCAFLLTTVACGFAQVAPTLPALSGGYKVGRTVFHWVDTKRPETITPAPDDFRELQVYVWYPATGVAGTPAGYMPNLQALVASGSSGAFSNLFGPSWTFIQSDKLRSRSFDNAPLAPTGPLPILVFSPGGGTTAVAYTSQLEDLASHGYLVVAIDHTYDAPVVVFPDGRVLKPANDFWNKLRGEAPGDFEKNIADILSSDIALVIDRLESLQNDAASMFYSKLDLTRIGAFGHSRGGRVAARACQRDRRIKACLSQDGNMFWQPFWLDERGRSLEQPFMMLDHLDPELPDEVFAQMGTTRTAYVQQRSERQAEAREKIYGTIAAGSYHVTIFTPGVSHNSFLDVRLLGRPDSSGINIWPKDVQATTPHARILGLINTYTQAFFDRFVRRVPAPLLDLKPLDGVRVQRFGR